MLADDPGRGHSCYGPGRIVSTEELGSREGGISDEPHRTKPTPDLSLAVARAHRPGGAVGDEGETVTLSGATGGAYTLGFTDVIHGTITNGSRLVTGVWGPSYYLTVGEAISGPGIPAGTTIVGGQPALETLELSASLSWRTERCVLRRNFFVVSSENQRSTRFSHELEVGVKCTTNRG
jgi:hypothetical protein